MVTYTLLLLEDQGNLRQQLVDGLHREFKRLKDDSAVSQYLPSNIQAYENLDQLLQDHRADDQTFYGWITDWQLGTGLSRKDLTSENIYTVLATLLGGYSSAQILELYERYEHQRSPRTLPGPDKASFLMLEEYRRLERSLQPEQLGNLFDLVINSGLLVIYTSHPADALLRSNVEISLSAVGSPEAPLVLYKEKSSALDTDIRCMALAYLLAAKGYHGKLPFIGEHVEIPVPEGRSRLREDVARECTLAREFSQNELELFLLRCSESRPA